MSITFHKLGFSLSVALCLTAFLMSCETTVQTGRTAEPGAVLERAAQPSGTRQTIDALVLQARVMGMADEYAAEVAEIVYLMLLPRATTARERALAQSFMRNSFGAAIDIAAGPNPEVALLDLLALIRLQRVTFERHWMPEVWGEERGRLAVDRLQTIESSLWAASSDLLTEDQSRALQRIVDAWLEENPNRHVVELVRFSDFDDDRHLSSAANRLASRTLIGELGEIVRVFDETRLFGERALWYSSRLPYVLGEQTELVAYRLLNQPEAQQILANLDELRETSRDFVGVLEALPEDFRHQRESLVTAIRQERIAAVQQLSQELDDFRTRSFDDLDARGEALQSTVHEARETIVASRELMVELQATTSAVDQLMDRFDRETTEHREPVEIAELRALAKDAAQTADRATRMLRQLDASLASPEFDKRLAALDGTLASAIDRAFRYLLVIVALIIAAVIASRFILRRASSVRA